MSKTIRAPSLRLFAFLVGVISCTGATADTHAALGNATIMAIQLRIPPNISSQVSKPAPKTLLDNDSTPIRNPTNLLKHSLCISHSQKTLYSLDTQLYLPRQKTNTRRIWSLEQIQSLLSPRSKSVRITKHQHKSQLSPPNNNSSCLKISHLINQISPISDADKSFTDSRGPVIVTVTINTE